MQAKLGIWTPWALVLCLECHGPKFCDDEFDPEIWETLIEPHELKEKKGLTVCDKCGTQIQVDYDVASEHKLGVILKEIGIPAVMEQTGGMNHALTIPCTDGGSYYVTFNFDGDHLWVIGRQDEDASPVGESFQTENVHEMVEYIGQLKDIDYNCEV